MNACFWKTVILQLFFIDMPIKVSCTCGQTFKAKDHLAGKRVRCPKCSSPLVIPAPETDELTLEAPVDVPKYNPLDDILKEEGVKEAHAGPSCPNCTEPISPTAVICVQCGFNLQTGEKVSANFDDEDDDEELAMAGMSETDKMLYKAEKEIEDMPISADGEKFGDEGDSYIIATVMLVGIALLVGLAIFTIMQLDQIEDFNTPLVSGWMSVVFVIGAMVSVTITAFKERPLEGYLCLTVVYIEWYATTRGLYVQLGIMNLFGAIAGGCFAYLGNSG